MNSSSVPDGEGGLKILKFPNLPILDLSWTPVQSFDQLEEGGEDENDTDEWIEEVEYVTLDFGPSTSNSSFNHLNFESLGLNSDTPFFKFGNQIYRGAYESLIGTELIMSQKDSSTSNVTVTTNGYQPIASTNSRIRLIPVKLDKKEISASTEPISNECTKEVEVDKSLADDCLSNSDPECFVNKSTRKLQRAKKLGTRQWASNWKEFKPRNKDKNTI
ncbi:hypothetical protein BY996DRAFT_6410765 [Phakopsora pachyrhizi]|uniref:Expressed protein n=1 Tax=Phakopsora pachyrhizi TaxID=170000 RepID=A0AAV0BS91_PHAPC|nr:hypothetical protein BY996DRAFT_6410765 [Phakopsora pachyrhizi]CAH7689537.1 expressed protein [Phakopsora pachyrhizi]